MGCESDRLNEKDIKTVFSRCLIWIKDEVTLVRMLSILKSQSKEAAILPAAFGRRLELRHQGDCEVRVIAIDDNLPCKPSVRWLVAAAADSVFVLAQYSF